MAKFKFPNPLDKKYRWILIGGAVVILLVLIFSGRRSSAPGDGSGYYPTGPSENLQIAAMQIGAQSQAQMNALRAQENQSQVELAMQAQAIQGALASQTLAGNIDANAYTAQLSAMTQQLSSQENIERIRADTMRAEIAAFRDTTMQATQANVDMFAMNTQASLYRDELNASVWNNQILSQRDIELGRIGSTTQIELARVDVEGRRIDAATQIELDRGVTERFGISSSNKQNQSNNRAGIIGTVVGTIGRILTFSDVRVKDYIRQTGETPDGLPWYEYSISGFTQAGVMAQEAMTLYPEAVSPHYTGLLTVDYGYMGINSRGAA